MQTPLTMLLALSVLSLAVNVFAKDCDKAQRKATTVGQVGSGYGEISQAPRWLQEERSALYFPLRHKSRYMFEHSKSHPQAWKEYTLKQERTLIEVNTSFVSWETGGDSDTSFYSTIALGSNNQVFNVLIDTGVGLSWVQCECVRCASSTQFNAAPLHKPLELTTTSHPEKCTENVCKSLMSESPNDFSCGKTTEKPYCQYDQQYLDGGGSQGVIITDSITVETGLGDVVQPPIQFGCGMAQSGSLLNGTISFDGVLGLAPSNYSIVQRLAANKVIRNSFSVCLDGSGGEGHLILGRKHMSPSAVFTPAITNKGNYWKAKLLNINVNDKINIPVGTGSSGLDVIFDTGSGGTLLPFELYKSVFSTLFPDISNSSLQAFPYSPCLQFKGNLSTKDLAQFYSPINLRFANAANSSQTVDLSIPAFNFLDSYGQVGNDGYNQFCINGYGVKSNDSSVPGATTPIIGAPWLRNLDIIFDGENNVIGWYPVECKSGNYMDSFGLTYGQAFSFPNVTSPPSNTADKNLTNLVSDAFPNVTATSSPPPTSPPPTSAAGPASAPSPSELPPASEPSPAVAEPPPQQSPPSSLFFAPASPPPPSAKSGANSNNGFVSLLVSSLIGISIVLLLV